MIVFSNPTPIKNEINLIHSLFAEDLELFHIRKPEFSEQDMIEFLSQISLEYRNRLVLHQHHQLAEAFGINRIHFIRKERIQILDNPISTEDSGSNSDKVKSTSVHSITTFNAANFSSHFDYAFLSPVFPSISKPGYVPTSKILESIKERTNFKTKLIALGGVTPETIKSALENGFDDVALLGTIWTSTNPVENFKLCQQAALSHSL